MAATALVIWPGRHELKPERTRTVKGKRVVVGGGEYGIENASVDTVVDGIKKAMENGSVTVLPLLDSAGRPIVLYLNGKVTATVAVDLDGDPRPSEIC